MVAILAGGCPMLSMLCGILALVAWVPWFSNLPLPSPGGVNKATFDRIKSGMTPQQVHALIGREPDGIWGSASDYSEMEVWDHDYIRIRVEYEPALAKGKVTRAFFDDYSTRPNLSLKLKRSASKEECAKVNDQLIADSQTKRPLLCSVALSKEIPVNEAKALKYIIEHPDYQSYHLLLALRYTNPTAYKSIAAEVRAAVLCSTLKEQDCFDDWTPPDCAELTPDYATDAEKALIEIGIPAIVYLLPLLDDHSAAVDSEYEEEPEYEYRRADYVFRYISWILKLPYSFQPEPADRDKDIRALKKRLVDGVRFIGLGGQ
jgi:hypothetical protein